MKFLQKLLKPKPLTLDERLARLESLDESELSRLTTGEDVLSLRQAALARLNQLESLTPHIEGGELQAPARQRVAQLLDRQTLTPESVQPDWSLRHCWLSPDSVAVDSIAGVNQYLIRLCWRSYVSVRPQRRYVKR